MRCERCKEYFQSEYALQKLCGECAPTSIPNGKQNNDRNPAPQSKTRVKPLEWRALAVTDREAAVADSILGKWEVWQFPNGSTYIMKPGEHQGTVYEDSYDEAKAYLERVYQRRIAPALTTEGQTDA